MTEYSSAEGLSGALRFPIADLSILPFSVKDTEYVSIWDEVGEINYTGQDGQSAIYRKSFGTEDNSGNYDTFKNMTQLTAAAVTITLKGAGSVYTLALWTDGTYSYSISLSTGIGIDEWSQIISAIS